MLNNYKLLSFDGEIGKVCEFYFDDYYWTIRYLVAETENWLKIMQVLIFLYAIVVFNEKEQNITIDLTQKQIEDSSSLDSDKPVSHQFEETYYGYYGYPIYWSGLYMWGPYPYIVRDREKWKELTHGKKAWEPHLCNNYDVGGHHIMAADGDGSVESGL